MQFASSFQYKLHLVQNFRDHSHDNSFLSCYLCLGFNSFVEKGENVIFDICVMRHRSLGPGELCAKFFICIIIVIIGHGDGVLRSSQD